MTNIRHLVALVSIVLLTVPGCGTKPPIVNVAIHNGLTNDLDWVTLAWSGPDIPAGILPAGGSATSVGVEWPMLKTAKLTFVDHLTRKPSTINVTFSEINDQLRSGKFRDVTISIVDADKAEVTCR